MHKSFASLLLMAAFFAGCVSVAPPPNRSAADPSNASAPEASARRFRPNLVATTNVYLDPSAGRGAQKMDHSNMQGMGGMQGMDHSKMPGMEPKQPPGQISSPPPQQMQNMDHSKMPGMEDKQSGATPAPPPGNEMQGMDHSKMPGMGAQQPAAAPPSKEAVDAEMKKTSDEMKKLSDELKAKSDAAKAAEKTGPKSTAAAASPAVIYTCSMHPEIQQPNPGKCPKCGMTLVQQETPQKKEKR